MRLGWYDLVEIAVVWPQVSGELREPTGLRGDIERGRNTTLTSCAGKRGSYGRGKASLAPYATATCGLAERAADTLHG